MMRLWRCAESMPSIILDIIRAYPKTYEAYRFGIYWRQPATIKSVQCDKTIAISKYILTEFFEYRQ